MFNQITHYDDDDVGNAVPTCIYESGHDSEQFKLFGHGHSTRPSWRRGHGVSQNERFDPYLEHVPLNAVYVQLSPPIAKGGTYFDDASSPGVDESYITFGNARLTNSSATAYWSHYASRAWIGPIALSVTQITKLTMVVQKSLTERSPTSVKTCTMAWLRVQMTMAAGIINVGITMAPMVPSTAGQRPQCTFWKASCPYPPIRGLNNCKQAFLPPTAPATATMTPNYLAVHTIHITMSSVGLESSPAMCWLATAGLSMATEP